MKTRKKKTSRRWLKICVEKWMPKLTKSKVSDLLSFAVS